MAESKCPYLNHKKLSELSLNVLNPAKHFEHIKYAEEFKKLDLDEVKQDIFDVMTTSQDWWPADYGHYGPLFIRMAWHAAGTYRSYDGRGGANTGNQRFAPLNSWPDNGNLDKARRLLWPIKRKYGKKLSWADLMVFTGVCAVEHMGGKVIGFAGGRIDCWEPEADVYWGPETAMLAAERYHSDSERGAGDHATLENPLAAVQMGLVYVNPEGPGGNLDPLSAANDIRVTFKRMAMNDEETVALIAGGHTFGKGHGAHATEYVGPSPEDAPIEQQGFGWKNSAGSGMGADTITSGLEGAWTNAPTTWDNGYFTNLFKYEWKHAKTPAGATVWKPTVGSIKTVPSAHDPSKLEAPIMYTTDLALIKDPTYAKISKHFFDNPKDFEDAFAKAWYKLLHRDMGPIDRCLGKYVGPEQLWQDPVGSASGRPINDQELEQLKSTILASGLSSSQLVSTAWASASTHRVTDFRGGANGARIRLLPQKDWKANNSDLPAVLAKLSEIQAEFNQASSTQVSMADLIVLGGCVAVEEAASKGGHEVKVSFTSGRTDATQEQTDVESMEMLRPHSDGFRNYNPSPFHLVDKAQTLALSAPEMAVLVGGLRVLNANTNGSQVGVLTKRVGTLSNDFFVNLLDMCTSWHPVLSSKLLFEGRDRAKGTVQWVASSVDLIFGSNSELRAIAEAYACDDANATFVEDFANAFAKVMDLDRFDV